MTGTVNVLEHFLLIDDAKELVVSSWPTPHPGLPQATQSLDEENWRLVL